MSEEQLQEALRLIEQELRTKESVAAQVLFGDEFGASDWEPVDAVNALFSYATKYGWGEE